MRAAVDFASILSDEFLANTQERNTPEGTIELFTLKAIKMVGRAGWIGADTWQRKKVVGGTTARLAREYVPRYLGIGLQGAAYASKSGRGDWRQSKLLWEPSWTPKRSAESWKVLTIQRLPGYQQTRGAIQNVLSDHAGYSGNRPFCVLIFQPRA